MSMHEGEVTIEHQLPQNMSVSGAYVVSRALRLPMFYDSNMPFHTSRINTSTGPILTGVRMM